MADAQDVEAGVSRFPAVRAQHALMAQAVASPKVAKTNGKKFPRLSSSRAMSEVLDVPDGESTEEETTVRSRPVLESARKMHETIKISYRPEGQIGFDLILPINECDVGELYISFTTADGFHFLPTDVMEDLILSYRATDYPVRFMGAQFNFKAFRGLSFVRVI